MDAVLGPAGVFFSIAAVGIYAYYTGALLSLKLDVGRNSDAFASEVFVRLLGEAQESMLVCDDGNKMDVSVYEDDSVVDAVRTKLNSYPEFKMYCLFSDTEETKFLRAFNDEPRVRIKSGVRRRPVHYKIIDGGRSGYLSRHAHGETQRSYKLYEGATGWVREMALGRHIADIEREFQHAG